LPYPPKGLKEWSVDIEANWFGPSENNVRYELQVLVECKYRSPDKFILFLEDPNENYSPATLGGTINTFDTFVPYSLSLDSFVPLEESHTFVYKGLELYDRGAIEEDLRHGIQQLRYATPALLRSAFDTYVFGHQEDVLALYFTKMLVTNSKIRILNRGTDISGIKSASTIDDISRSVETVILYSDYGPDFEDHVRMIFGTGAVERAKAAQRLREVLTGKGKKFRFADNPAQLLEAFAEAARYECRRVSTQFFVTTLAGLPTLVKAIKRGCRDSYRQRRKSKSSSERTGGETID
jgi:hypothetical protein